MFNLVMIEVAQREREREVHEEVRRRQLAAGTVPDPGVAHAAAAARADHRGRRRQPVGLATP